MTTRDRNDKTTSHIDYDAASTSAQYVDVSMLAELMLENAVRRILPDDHIWFTASFYPLPTDTSWEPSIMFYVMAQPVGDADGTHEGQYMSPYLIAQPLVDAFVQSFADRTVETRQRLRQARERGLSPQPGVAVESNGG